MVPKNNMIMNAFTIQLYTLFVIIIICISSVYIINYLKRIIYLLYILIIKNLLNKIYIYYIKIFINTYQKTGSNINLILI